ncbi:MAG TPA: response regulator transcription factor [Chitinophagaceae bacterium]|nr:response regulator transcription factor [Chitinophagaceae bacterium]
MVRIAIVDDRANNRNILYEKLRANEFFEVTMQAVNGEDFLQQMKTVAVEQRPHIVLMDLEMPVMDGVTAIAAGSSLYPEIKYVVLTIFNDDENIFNAIQAGACGYILKEESRAVINDMLMNLWESGAGPISPSIAYKILQMVQQAGTVKTKKETIEEVFQLSDREKEILQLLSQGLDYKEIAARTFISPNTVKKHTINIYQKLHVNSKAQALRIAYTKGLL